MNFNDSSEQPLPVEGGETAAEERRSPLAVLVSLPRLVLSRYGLFALGLLAVGGLLYLATSADGFIKRGALEREKLKLETEIEALQDENRILRQKLERLQSDPGYIEDEARQKLGLVRPGETVYRLSEEPDLSEDPREGDPGQPDAAETLSPSF